VGTGIPNGAGHKDRLLATKHFVQWVGQPTANNRTATELKYQNITKFSLTLELTDMVPS
jgi:hypothetical protein